MLKKFFTVVIIITSVISTAHANLIKDYTERDWFWIFSDSKYSKYFDPSSVEVTKKAIKDKKIATEIIGWTKTTYYYTGAKETIENYELTDIIPDPYSLSYSLALVKINPQNRTLQYLREEFFDAKGKRIWANSESYIKEINSQSFDEDFYCAIVDEIFQRDEMEYKASEDRWMDLWEFTNEDGVTFSSMADTLSMRLKDSNLILWVWQIKKNLNKQTEEIRLLKKSINLENGTEIIRSGQTWTPSDGWKNFKDEEIGIYKRLKTSEPSYKGLVRLRTFVKNNSKWINRYSLD